MWQGCRDWGALFRINNCPALKSQASKRGSEMIDNPVRGRFNAWFLAALDSYMHWKYAAIKSSLLKQAPSVVVELGPGPGANLRYLPPGTKLIAIEPNRHMHPLLRRRAKQLGIELICVCLPASNSICHRNRWISCSVLWCFARSKIRSKSLRRLANTQTGRLFRMRRACKGPCGFRDPPLAACDQAAVEMGLRGMRLVPRYRGNA